MTTEPTRWQEIGPRFDGKVCIVTGSARGIGAAIVAALAQLGAKVGIADRDGAEEAAAALRAAGYDAIGIATDISYSASVSAMVEVVMAKWGRIDVLVNNAALATGLKPRPFDQIEDEEWCRVYEVNVFGTMRCAKAVSALMRAAGGGRIVNIASASALKGVPNLLHYVSSKGAVIAMTKALARELGGDGILVNAVAPGFTLSEATVENQEQMTQTRTVALQGRAIPRDQMPDDVVGAVLFLAGAGASFISGQTLVVTAARTSTRMDAPLDRIAAIVGEDHVLRDGAAMEPFLQEWRRIRVGEAAAVVRPGSTAEVSAMVAFCAERGVPITPQGGNTGLCGGAVPLSANGILLNLGRMARIREVNAAGFTLTAEAGAVLANVQQAAANCNRLFPLSLGSEGTAQIGGLVSTNAGGIQVMRYGTMRELVLGLEVVLPDGRILNDLSALRKDTTGYDLKQMFIGAEGTLGIVTAATLKLYPAIASRRTVFFGLPDSEAAVAIFSQLRERVSDRLLAAELIADACMDLALANVPAARNPLDGRHAWYLLVELDNLGDDSDTILHDLLMPALETGLAEDAVVALSIDQAHRMWFLREAIVEGERLEGGSAKHDISLPISAIPEFLASAGRRIETAMRGIRIAPFGHVGDGNLHYNLVRPVGMERADFLAASLALTDIVYDEVTRRAGSISAEHGIGLFKRDALAAHKSQLHLELMRRIKQVLDPHGLMNPEKVLRP